jgi:hypothetical protein
MGLGSLFCVLCDFYVVRVVFGVGSGRFEIIALWFMMTRMNFHVVQVGSLILLLAR